LCEKSRFLTTFRSSPSPASVARLEHLDEEQVALLGLDVLPLDVASHPVVAALDPVVDRVVVAVLRAERVRPVEVDLRVSPFASRRSKMIRNVG
jgi:hypothetical protein